MSAAIFGLIGVVIGALVTGGVTFFLEWRRERAALRAGLRLVGEELKDMLLEVQIMVDMRAWGPPEVRQGLGGRISHEQWDRHRDVFAAQLSPTDWVKIAGARDIGRSLRARFDQVKADTDPSWMFFSDAEQSILVGQIERLQEIVKRIAILVNEPPPPKWASGWEWKPPRDRTDKTIRRGHSKQAPPDR
jgi:hypothetical protein